MALLGGIRISATFYATTEVVVNNAFGAAGTFLYIGSTQKSKN